MHRQTQLIVLIILQSVGLCAQDSASTKVHPRYNNRNGLHRTFFGENYRKEWAADTKLPLIRLSQVAGGLKPLSLGGGKQTLSLRLVAPDGDEWVLRSIEKDASVLLPPTLRETFAKDLVDDAMSAQHPFSPLVVQDLAKAAGVPHAEPVIGIVQNESILGEFNKQFEGKVCLLEKREPFGNSDNTQKMLAELDNDNDNKVDYKAFIRATLLDLLIGDWDRHADQWRWVDIQKGKEKLYVGVPRDRDQAFYLNQGIAPGYAAFPWVVPDLQGFRPEIRHVKFSLLKQSFLASTTSSHIPEAEWMKITNDFIRSISDDVIDEALKRLPESAYNIRHNELSAALKKRRDNIPAAIKEYYRFINKIAELKLSNKNEMVQIKDTTGNSLLVQVNKLKNNGEMGELLMRSVFNPGITKEFRLFTGKGNDSILIDNSSSPVKIRLVGDEGNKSYNVIDAYKKIRVYNKSTGTTFSGLTEKLRKHISDDTSNTNFHPANRYNIWMPLVGFAINKDDGFVLGLGSQYIHQGFRKNPYASLNRLMLYYAFATSAFRIKYSGEWIDVFGRTDLIANADIYAPENKQNFFGQSNESPFQKAGDYRKYYRARFKYYQMTVAPRWGNPINGVTFSAGPSYQRYSFDSSENTGRFILSEPVKSYDSSNLGETKAHAGIVMNFNVNRKNSQILPTQGYYLNVRLQGFGGLNNNSKGYGQLIPEFSVYQKLNSKGTIVLADRIGGGITVGKSAFYQSLYIGGHENLLGYRQYRFAGEDMIYNNFELRIKIANFTGYIVPGQFGLVGFFDVGRVWVDGENSDKWHNGIGGGVFFAPASIFVVNVVAGYSREGWLPYVTMGFRF